jgi:hypothetical protein
MTAPAKRSTAVIILSIIVAIETVIIMLLGGFAAYLWGQQSFYAEDMFYGMPSAEDDEMWMLADQTAMDVGYLILDDDLQAYLDLYDANDSHVDFDSVEADFREVVEKAQEAEGDIEYMSDMMAPMVYEDEATGETIMRLTISGMDYYSGRSAGGRLTVYVLYDDGDTVLTGKEGRELSVTDTIW